MSTDIITELRSAATTLRTPTGCVLPAQDRITAELLDRAADALQVAQVGHVADGIGFGELLSADFEADTITLRMEPGYQVRAGRHGLFHTQHDMQGQASSPTASVTAAPGSNLVSDILTDLSNVAASWVVEATGASANAQNGCAVQMHDAIERWSNKLRLGEARDDGSGGKPQPAPSWEGAPAWARFVAMDADGQWSWYENRPYPETDLGSDEFTLWDAEDGHIQPISSGNRFYGWENSLQERPAPRVSVKVAGAPLSAEQAAEAMRQIEGDEVQR